MFKYFLFIILTFSFFFALNSTLSKLSTKKQNHRLLFPAKYAQVLSFGQKELISSFLWIDLIQNSSIIKDDDPFEFNRSQYISHISPYFYFNYKYNGLIISVVKDQFNLADRLYLLGIKYFPQDYSLLFQAGFNNIFLRENYELGLKYFSDIYEKKIYIDNNKTFPLIYSRAMKKSGNKNLSRQILRELYEQTNSELIKKAILERLD